MLATDLVLKSIYSIAHVFAETAMNRMVQIRDTERVTREAADERAREMLNSEDLTLKERSREAAKEAVDAWQVIKD